MTKKKTKETEKMALKTAPNPSKKGAVKVSKKADTSENESERNERLRRQLVQRRDEILKEAKSEIKKQVSGENRQFVETVMDDGDLAVVDVSEDINLRQLTTHRQTLIKIDAALNKLREGSYGICEECGGEIEEGRLRVMPFAICCRDCQEIREEKDKMEAQHD